MSLQPLDTTLALKALNLSAGLSNTDRRVGGAILDHYNRRSTQCDPSFGTVATLLGVSRRTVIRSVNRLVAHGFFKRIRHGGKYHRNQYFPIWSRFRTIEAEWKQRRHEHSNRFRGSELSPLQRQTSHRSDDSDGTQTYPINQTLETSPSARFVNEHAQSNSLDAKKRLGKTGIVEPIKSLRQTFHVKQTSSREAAKDAAERRWCNALSKRYKTDPIRHARILEVIDEALHAAATDAELSKPGTGLFLILEKVEANPARRARL